MPQGETFWNPYHWVRVSDKPVEHATPAYQHRWQGLAGRLWCELEALTPLLIGDGSKHPQTIKFVQRGNNGPVFIPGTSLKGAIRSLAELVGNAAVPFRSQADAAHAANRASKGEGSKWQLDVAARLFGFLDKGRVFSGLVRFSDAAFVDGSALVEGKTARPDRWPTHRVAGGTPDPDHKAFYPAARDTRKFYHHQAGLTTLTPPHAGIREDQKRTVRPAPPGTRFTFMVDFVNLREEELNLLLYCLVLEENATVTLGINALAVGAIEPLMLAGPLRHKLGGCKPQGAGSVRIRILKAAWHSDPAARYRQADAAGIVLEGDPLQAELSRRTAGIRGRSDVTMQQLRAMLIYSSDDPRGSGDVNYPTYGWFKDNPTRPLKPTL